MKLKKRIAALLMAGAMVCSTLPVNVLAVESSDQNVGGLCEHHTEHNADCGYTEGIEGTPCNHEHTEDCYTLVTSCVHKHTADCYPAESVSDNTASPSDAENREPTECSHECSEDTGCIKKELDCKHEHDEACGYVPATEGRPCGYICGECDVEDEPETATPSNAAQLSAGDVQKLIDALPATDKLTTMTKDEQNAVYADLQAAYEAYEALTEDEQALLTGTEVFESLFHFFNGMVNLLAENGVSYLDKNGDEQTAENVTVVESSTTAWSDGWYVVNGAVTIGNRATVSGDVRLILEDGAVLTIEKGIQVQDDDRDPSNGSANQLTIYAQSDGENMGTLTANGNNGGAGIGGGDSGSGGNITINGGNVTATGGQYAAGIGGGNGGSGGTVTIHGGNVTASSGDSGAGIGGGRRGSGGEITIHGGSVTATGGQDAAGIGGGHKVLTIPHKNGKLEAAAVKHYLERFYQDGSCTHMVQPGMVYISHPTEYGTLYTKEELKALRRVCEEYQLPLFLDGARLGYGLCAPGTDVTLADLAELCDVFYIGGTKVGALFGEAVVFPKKNTVPGFFTLMKQQGAVLAKGRLLGIQFDTLFTENLYLKISAHAIEMAMRIKELLTEHGCPLYINSPTNQQFVVLNAAQREALKDRVSCETWEELENGAAAVRFASSWATKSEDVEELGRILKTLP